MKRGFAQILLFLLGGSILLMSVSLVKSEAFRDKITKQKSPVANQNVSSPDPNTVPFSPSPFTEPSLNPSAHIDAFISYQIPTSWRKNILPTSEINITSSDYVTMFTNEERGVLIRILLDVADKELREYINPDYQTDVKELTIDNIPALSSHSDYEHHTLSYSVIKDGKYLQIIVLTKNLEQEKKYIPQINFFISSIKFR